jgi:hypothetical protein
MRIKPHQDRAQYKLQLSHISELGVRVWAAALATAGAAAGGAGGEVAVEGGHPANFELRLSEAPALVLVWVTPPITEPVISRDLAQKSQMISSHSRMVLRKVSRI